MRHTDNYFHISISKLVVLGCGEGVLGMSADQYTFETAGTVSDVDEHNLRVGYCGALAKS